MLNDQKNDLKTDKKKLTRRERKMRKTREDILTAAKDLFIRMHYDDIVMENISEKADLSRATLYNHFKSKEDIYFEIGINELDKLTKDQRKLLNPKDKGLEQLLLLTRHFLERQLTDSLVPRIYRKYLILNRKAEFPAHIVLEKIKNGETIENTSSIQLARYLEAMRKFENIWQIVLKKGQEDNSIKHQFLNDDQLIHYLFIILLGIIDRVELEQIALKKVKLTNQQLLTATIDLIRKDLS